MVAEPVGPVLSDMTIDDVDHPRGSAVPSDEAVPGRVAVSPGAAATESGTAAALIRDASTALAEAVHGLAVPVKDVSSLPRAQQVGLLRQLLESRDVLSSLITQVGAAVDASGAWRLDRLGARDYTDWLARISRSGTSAARAERAKQSVMTALPAFKEASATPGSGVTSAHVGAMARVMDKAQPETRKRLVESAADLLVQAQVTDAATFAKQLRATTAAWEADAADATFEEARDARFLRLWPSKGAMRIEGLLDPVAGKSVRVALEALTPTPSVGDERTPDQRRADTFADLAARTLSFGQRKGSQLRPTVSVLMREETLAAARARQRIAHDAANPETDDLRDRVTLRRSSEALRRAGLDREPPLAELENRTTLAPAALEVLLCDAFVRRVVLDPAGQPLDVGLAERTFSGPLRAAILTRDRHCQWPGCTLRATWAEIHHIQWWSDDGPTSLENGITVCSFHHHLVHRDLVQITPVPGGFVFRSHDGTRIGASTRLHDHLLTPSPTAGSPPGPDRDPHGSPGAASRHRSRRVERSADPCTVACTGGRVRTSPARGNDGRGRPPEIPGGERPPPDKPSTTTTSGDDDPTDDAVALP